MRLVLDTNTVLALWHFADPGLVPLAAALGGGRFILASREDALEELHQVLARPRFGIRPEEQARIIEHYRGYLAPVPASASGLEEGCPLPLCRDRDDQKFLEIARDSAAACLLTRDKLLLKLNGHRLLRDRFRIMTPERFLAESAVLLF
ncbi:MAG: PIN domain-containing protein [Azoarcus sp.]|jgi:predicted nucleic acid-binding protein|nr:PIN domain-containing protein [Azoarcus sp.]